MNKYNDKRTEKIHIFIELKKEKKKKKTFLRISKRKTNKIKFPTTKR